FFWPMWPKWLPLYFSLKNLAHANKPDIIICGKALFEGRLALLFKKTLGIPYIVCTYGMEIATWSNVERNKKQLKKVLHHANAVLYINDQTKQELHTLGVDEAKLHALYPGIDEKTLHTMNNPDDVLQKYAIKAPYIISVARLVKRKGMDDLIEAFANVSSHPLQLPLGQGERTRLIIVGDGPERKILEKLVKKRGANVVFLGQVPDEDVRALYSKATLFALTPKELPGDYEGFGIVYLEAAYFGLPVIGTKTGGVAGAVQDGVTGLLAEPGNVASIQDALQKILSEPTLATQYGKQGRQRVMKEFLWNTIINKLEVIIKNILV
ncbi:MAG: glycosyltransferase family 4 protein, partial [bacterium]|nr:glycosyltransferase family 4 protein [bacterium]